MTVEMESATEARRLIEIGQQLGIRRRVAVRVNPDFEIKGSGMRMGGGPQQFGVDAEQVPALLKRLATRRGGRCSASTCSRVRRTCGPTSWLRRSARPSTSFSGWPRSRPRQSATSTSAEGSASPTSRRTRRWI